MVVPAAIGGAFIRIGNFINSEIIGIETGSDFGVVFKQLPVSMQNPRHPAQLTSLGIHYHFYDFILHLLENLKV